ncbi:MAG: VOC family protein [Woeseiaceae bacterium]
MKTHGLTHVALAVKDVKRSLAFYQKVLGVVPVYRDEDSIQAQTPGTHDVLVFERGVKSAGGKVLSKGEFAPGLPSVFFEDPDGYEVEVWYEMPTPADPKPVRSGRKAR